MNQWINVLTLSALSSSPLMAVTAINHFQESSIQKVSYSQDITWVNQLVNHYPELVWLAGSDVKKTEENTAVQGNGSWSERLFGQNYPEFDRTMMTIACLRTILNGSDNEYEKFVSKQPESIRLTKEEFYNLQNHLRHIIESNPHMTASEMIKTLEIGLVLGDMGKTSIAREKALAYGINAPDHDDFYAEVLEKCPHIFTAYKELTPAGRELLSKTSDLAHFGHIFHLEGGPEMFSKLKDSNIMNEDPMAFEAEFFIHACDVAGALGHVTNESSITFNSNTYHAHEAIKAACYQLQEGNEIDAFNAYLSQRAELLGLDASNPQDRVLTRIGAMLRFFTPDEGQLLKTSFKQLPELEQQTVIAQLNCNEINKDLRTPTYVPAVLLNLFNNKLLGESKEERLTEALRIGLPFISKVLQAHKKLISQENFDRTIPICFNFIAGIAKTNPYHLVDGVYDINSDGDVYIH